MKKKQIQINKIVLNIIMILVFLCNMIFAISVSENDENAFITRSEFETLRDKFKDDLSRYNSNIDNKIDEAIALYLSGFSLKDEEEMKIFDTEAEEVLMYNVANPQWTPTMGRLSWEIYSQDCRYSMSTTRHVGDYIVHCTPLSPIGGTYAFIDSETFTSSFSPNVAEWKGVSDNVKDTLILYGGYKNTSYYGSYWTTLPDDCYPRLSSTGSFWGLSNVNWLNEYGLTGQRYPFSFYLATSTDTGSARVYLNVNGGNLQTDYGKLKYKNLFTPKNTSIPRIRHINQQRWWTNDSAWNSDVSLQTPNYNEIFDDFIINARFVEKYYQSSDDAETFYKTIGNGGNYTTGYWRKPYVGFVNNISNTSQLYISKYDGMVSIINKYYPSFNSSLLKTQTDGNFHYPMWAGYPLAKVVNKGKYRYIINFKDNNEYYLALKNEPFNSSSFMAEDTSLLSFTGGTEVAGKKYRKVKNGDEIRWTATKDGYIFLKWSLATNNDDGGGILVPQASYYHIVDRNN